MNKILLCLSFTETANVTEHTGQNEKHVSNDNSSGQSYNGKCSLLWFRYRDIFQTTYALRCPLIPRGTVVRL